MPMCLNDFIRKKERVHSQSSTYIPQIRLLNAQLYWSLLERERGGMNKRQLKSTLINTFHCQQKSSVNRMIQHFLFLTGKSLGALDEVMHIWNSRGGRAESCYYYQSPQTKEASRSPLHSSTDGEERRRGWSKYAVAHVRLYFEKGTHLLLPNCKGAANAVSNLTCFRAQ